MEKPTGSSAGFNLEEGMPQHLNFLALMLVIVIIKVKIIIKNRQGNGPVSSSGPAHPRCYPWMAISRSPSAIVSVPRVAARISSTVKPGAISSSRNPLPAGSNSP